MSICTGPPLLRYGSGALLNALPPEPPLHTRCSKEKIRNRRQFLDSVSRAAASAALTASCSPLLAQQMLQTGPSWLQLDGRPAGWALVRGGNTTLQRAPIDRGAPGHPLPPASADRRVSDLRLALPSA